MNHANSLTTGEIAKYCDVSLRTVIRWIDRGHLKSYKLPGRGNNRILIKDFISFLHKHDMPIPEELHRSSNKILIVDDDRNMASALKRLFKQNNYYVRATSKSIEAGVLLSEFEPTLMLLDLMMPGMNGFEVLQFVRDSEFSHTKVLVLSAAGDRALEKAIHFGADLAMEKPFNSDELLRNTANLINKKT